MSELLEKLQLVNTYVGYFGIPVDVIGLARRLGIRVFDAPWPDNISGKIQRDEARGGESGFAIFVNEKHPETRKRFTIAHEIAHYVLHEDQIGDGVFDDALYRSGLPEKIEAQANNLAADILMPWSELKQHVGEPVDQLAEMFNVSTQAMAVRLGVFA
ncbi:ImmA/IrrE family metallo-endopeptidase [Rhizobium hidalgonense]|uniref:ImmA/IrrE family metallo-endopeptidase n=1 Tax=Rhizobium hidalgonense TaxID=1538159 RepID=A0AAJ2LMX4_9HYPH|nr:ImmA/IrrE family metallo-endopeptidase [Rhizobium hidalgonense]MDR9774119.1 ImmA/IrrE family metallo-endopeptidase [Rhizobium hidalgonense]MDR9820594.1 ImmA/IrrE family metallo-endopeptidase [Rhizobium hidalgonense]